MQTEPFKVQIIEHAEKNPMTECCGFLLQSGNSYEVMECRNISDDPENFFEIHPQDTLSALRSGRAKAYYHSHPKTPAVFSEADKKFCEESQLPAYVYSLQTKQFAYLAPSGYQVPYEGRIFCCGIHDCFNLVQDVYKEDLKIELTDFPRNLEVIVRGSDDAAEWVKQNKFFRVDKPYKKYDVIAMALAGNGKVNHSAVYWGDGVMLHHVLSSPSGKKVYGGYWEQVTLYVLRHESLL